MLSKSKLKIIIILFVVLAVAGGIWFVSQNRGAPGSTMDAMERGLEMYRHEQLLARIAENDAVLSEFTTDGCSGGLSVSWEQFAVKYPEFAARHGELPPWQDCCVIHDRQYHAGGAGTSSATVSFRQRKKADLALRACVLDTVVQRSSMLREIYGLTEGQVRDLYLAVSELMYRAVRVGGIPCTSQSWRWGYGWPPCRHDSKDQGAMDQFLPDPGKSVNQPSAR